MIAEGVCHPCEFIASDIQNPSTVQLDQVLRSSGVTSESMLDHLSGSAKLVVYFSSTHPDFLLLRLSSTFEASMPRRNTVVMVFRDECDLWKTRQRKATDEGGLGYLETPQEHTDETLTTISIYKGWFDYL